MEFHLLYQGPLHSNAGISEKHSIRRAFHPQLKQLWHLDRNLQEMAARQGRNAFYSDRKTANPDHPPKLARNISDDKAAEIGFSEMAKHWTRHGYDFLPLVPKGGGFRCRLDILFLRAEEKNYILQGGDVDGRIKTLFDALRIIREPQEVPSGSSPTSDENPFYCLLEDDELVSSLFVDTNRLLALPGKPQINKSDVFLEITVNITPTRIGLDNYIV